MITVTKPCGYCGKAVERRPSHMRQPVFCDRTCFRKSRVGDGIRRYGEYIYIYTPNHLYANVEGYVAQHRLVMEALLGRLLNQDEVVHHINGVKSDNRVENLAVMAWGEHSRLERMYGRTDRWSRDYDCCVECGTSTKKHTSRGRCTTCNSRHFTAYQKTSSGRRA